ncbi:MAG: GGDEF domain-containing protein [Candidatus Limnocylindrales bacterium]
MSAAPESEAMEAVEPLVAILAVATVALVVMAALIGAALSGRGPLYGRLLDIQRRPRADDRKAGPGASPVSGIAISPSVRLLARDRRPGGRNDALAHRGLRPSDEELDDVLQGALAAERFDRAVRVLAWSSILVVLVTVSISQLWQPVEPQILVILTLAGIVVLGVHELVPPGNLGALRIVLEGSAAIVFLTMLVLLTGGASSAFFFIYPLLVGAAALVGSPRVTFTLAAETAVAYAIAAFSGPLEGAAARDALVRVAINLTALVLLSYAGMTISRVQRRTREAAIRLSAVDSLTDLYNRAYFFTSLDREIQRSRRFKRGFCLLMLDLDGLKSINDRYGHYHGDLVLRGVAHVIRSGLRGVDIAARYGGDEFVALLPETDPSGAYVVAEKIRQVAREMIVDVGGQKIRTSLSIGLVSFPDDGQTADELMIAADQAMYSSKRLGKNRVVGYGSPDDPTAPLLAQPYPTPVSTPGFRLFARDARPFGDRELGERDRAESGERGVWEQGDRDRGDRGDRGFA